jgi:hypothetical protein
VLLFVAVAGILISGGGTIWPPGLLSRIIGSDQLPASAIEGTWYAEVAYSWGVRASEQFEFRMDGERLLGTASFGGARFPRRILEGKLARDRLFFNTKLKTLYGRAEKEITYQYTGELKGSTIQFTLDNEGEPRPGSWPLERPRKRGVPLLDSRRAARIRDYRRLSPGHTRWTPSRRR